MSIDLSESFRTLKNHKLRRLAVCPILKIFLSAKYRILSEFLSVLTILRNHVGCNFTDCQQIDSLAMILLAWYWQYVVGCIPIHAKNMTKNNAKIKLSIFNGQSGKNKGLG